jgi:murein endopeptidase
MASDEDDHDSPPRRATPRRADSQRTGTRGQPRDDDRARLDEDDRDGIEGRDDEPFDDGDESLDLDRQEADGPSDDDPSLDDDAGDGEDDTPPEVADHERSGPAAPEPRRSIGPSLLVFGGGVWAIVAALRCAGPAAPETTASIPAAPEPAAPALADDGLGPDAPAEEGAPQHEPEGDEPVPARDDGAAELGDGGEPPPPEEEPPATPQDPLEAPDVVHYQIRRGGTMKNVANLFKIHHHEIVALNPGIDLERELAPGTRLVVYRKPRGGRSESIGLPSAGSLEGGVPVLPGPGRELKAIPWKSWGTAHTVAALDRLLEAWAARGSVQPILVGNLSAREGGRLEPHSTHQSGRDVDLGYPQKLPAGEELNWREMNAQNLDAAETWELLQLLRRSGYVEVVYIDTSIQKLLHEHAVAHDTVPKNTLGRWLEYPRSSSSAFVQHVPGHTDHLHVRFSCPAEDTRCRSRR